MWQHGTEALSYFDSLCVLCKHKPLELSEGVCYTGRVTPFFIAVGLCLC